MSASGSGSSGTAVEFKVHFRRSGQGRRRLRTGVRPAPPPVELGRIPRISRLMALAIRFDELIRKGEIRDYAELARLGGVTRARISQIMDLLNLAPEIQEGLLFLSKTGPGQDVVTERSLRPISSEPDWSTQRAKAARIL